MGGIKNDKKTSWDYLYFISINSMYCYFRSKLNNGGLNDASDLAGALVEGEKDEDKDKETISQTDFFIDARSTRENNDASAIQGLKDVVENEKTSQSQKDAASAQITKIH
ncbi:stage III sporulation protein AH [Clostridium paraputrificum]|uniref:SpoIIIAH-like family protein n=1 Tax=Clostridium paraputrificum TaxID=29363 RepID=UPI000D93C618|nr:SpoIIIAH-like family protein [Clostridium paraputrificum]SQB90085.1 stage III sporulation protein AH [Clostridium paraputrificum]